MTARTILSPTAGFLREAGFTHSLNPARNCTFGCTYCYVPTMRVQAGLERSDWENWGKYTNFKDNAAELLAKQLRPGQIVYCSPLVDPYQPEEEHRSLMREILSIAAVQPPHRFVIQTRGPLILRDLDLLTAIPNLRVSFSVTTDDDRIRRLYEPHCAPIAERWQTIRKLREAGIDVFATLAPLLPCSPEALAELALEATGRDLVGDPLHVKKQGATTRAAALRIVERQGHTAWMDTERQKEFVARIAAVAAARGRTFTIGPPGFRTLWR